MSLDWATTCSYCCAKTTTLSNTRKRALTRPAPCDVNPHVVGVVRFSLSSFRCSPNDDATLLHGRVGGHHHATLNDNTLLLAGRLPPSRRYRRASRRNATPRAARLDHRMKWDVCSRLVRTQVARRRTVLDPGAILPVGEPGQHLAAPRHTPGRGDRHRARLEELTRLHRRQGAARQRPAEEEPPAGHRHPRPLRPFGWSASVPTGGRPQRGGRCSSQRRQLRDGHLAQRQGDRRVSQSRMEGKALQSQGCAAHTHPAGGYVARRGWMLS